ncbi:hypothetical protein BH09SUM1_BH09SUM1_20400 [soil metagenome]
MPRHSHLIYNSSRTDLRSSQSADDGEILCSSSLGVPVVWIFAFGGRNIWNPGDDVEARGGTVGRRNPYETAVEVAIVRLEQAEQQLQNDPYLYPFLSALPMLRRKMLLKPKAGYIRVVAPWVIGLEEAHIERWTSATAFAENCVNMVSANRTRDAILSLAELTPFCPFVPLGDSGDLARLASTPGYDGEDEELRLAHLTFGEPDNNEVFEKNARRDCRKALDDYRLLPPRAPIVTEAVQRQLKEARGESAGGFMGKLTGLFKKK